MISTKLIIRGILADLDGNVSVPLTKQFDDLSNPTAIKNMFSKTITLPATPINNKIFGNIWHDEHMNSSLFNASKRAPFTLLVNDNLFATGYIKLSKIKRIDNNKPLSYEINMFGGIGDFFYELGERELKDIIFDNDNMRHAIDVNSFIAPPVGMLYFLSYQGTYSDFESDKHSDGNGEILDLPAIIDEHQRGEYRSYYQRPAISIAQLINNIFKATEFDVKISDIFKATPYFNATYLALDSPARKGALVNHTSALLGYMGIAPINYGVGYTEHVEGSKTSILYVESAKYRDSSNGIFEPFKTINLTALGGGEKDIFFDLNIKMGFYGRNNHLGQPMRYSYLGRESPVVIVSISDASTGSMLEQLSYPMHEMNITVGAEVDVKKVVRIGNDEAFTMSGNYRIPDGIAKINILIGIYFGDDDTTGSSDIRFTSDKVINSNKIHIVGKPRLAISDTSIIRVQSSTDIRSGSMVDYSTLMPSGLKQLDFIKNFLKHSACFG